MKPQDLKKFLSQKPLYIILGAIVILFLLLRGCGSQPETANVYHLGRDRTWNSLDLMGKEKNLSAFSDDLIAAIASKAGFKFTLTATTAGDLIAQLENEDLDGILTNMQPEPQTEKIYVYSQPYFLTGPVLVTRIGTKVQTWEELKYKIIGVLNQSPLILEISKDSLIQLKLYDNVLRALSDLDEKKIDGVILGVIPANIYVHTFYAKTLTIATAPLTNEGLRMVTSRNSKGEELVSKFNKGLDELKADGTYQKLIDNWGLINGASILKP